MDELFWLQETYRSWSGFLNEKDLPTLPLWTNAILPGYDHRMIRKSLILLTVGCMLGCAQVQAAGSKARPKPKYGPMATVLSVSHGYFRRAPAPDFWALIPYYVPQMDDSACSVATMTMAVNGARAGKKLTADEKLATQKLLVKKVKDKVWHKSVLNIKGHFEGYAATLDQLGRIAREAFEAYHIHPKSIEVVHVDQVNDAMRAKLHQALVENEKSNRDFILINFNQQAFTGDADVGHFAPIGAYDAEKHRVLVLDPDREWYEPYWVSEETLLRGMDTKDSSTNRNRGYIWIKF